MANENETKHSCKEMESSCVTSTVPQGSDNAELWTDLCGPVPHWANAESDLEQSTPRKLTED